MSTRASLALRWILVSIGLLLVAVPFIWMVAGSFRPEADLFKSPGNILPGQWTTEGYRRIFSDIPFLRMFVNTVVFAGVTTGLLLVFDSMCAFALARLRFRGSTAVFWLVIITLLIPFQVTVVPVFVELFRLGWLNTYQGLIVPRAVSAFGIFMLRQFFISIPKELDEAARIDGAGNWRIYAQIILPHAKPALATLAVLHFMSLWNDLLWPLVATTDPSMKTLPAGLALFAGQGITLHAAVLAGATISLLPIAIAFVFAQRYFVAGVATSGLK